MKKSLQTEVIGLGVAAAVILICLAALIWFGMRQSQRHYSGSLEIYSGSEIPGNPYFHMVFNNGGLHSAVFSAGSVNFIGGDFHFDDGDPIYIATLQRVNSDSQFELELNPGDQYWIDADGRAVAAPDAFKLTSNEIQSGEFDLERYPLLRGVAAEYQRHNED